MDPSRLKSIPLFANVPEEDLHKIATFADETSVEEGKALVKEGDYAYDFMAIEEGTAEVRRGDETLGELGPGDFFGEIGVLEKDKRTATVVATSPIRLITLSSWDLKRVQSDMPETFAKIEEAAEERRARTS